MSAKYLVPFLFGFAIMAAAGETAPWPAPVPGFTAPAPGEHPRLFFRQGDVPALRQRAETEIGRKILERLRALVHEGTAPKELCTEGESRRFTLWHGAGFGFLFRITGEQRYADLAGECVRLMLAGEDDRDPRYSLEKGTGALRNGPALGALAMAYDLAYDGWEEAFRQEIAKAIATYDPGKNLSLDQLAVQTTHGPESNHFGAQIGGAALALLAVRGDNGAGDPARIERLLAENAKCFVANLTTGFGDGGYFAEHAGPGMISSDTAFVPALQAYRVAGGLDFITPRRNAPAVTLIRLYELMSIGDECLLMLRHPSSYGGQAFTAADGREGLSRGGQFAQGFGAVLPEHRGALKQVFETIVEPDPATRTYDTVSPYPHRAGLAFLNWPIDEPAVDPATVLPRVHHDAFHRYVLFRKSWTGTEADIAVSVLFGPGGGGNIGQGTREEPVFVWGGGARRSYGTIPQTAVTHLTGHADGSGSVAGEGFALAVDYSGASGAAAAVAMVGRTAYGELTVRAQDVTWRVVLIGADGVEPGADGRDLVIKDQRFTYADGKIMMAKTGAAIAGLPTTLPVIDDQRQRPLPPPLAIAERGPTGEPDRKRILAIGGRHVTRDGGWTSFFAALHPELSVNVFGMRGHVVDDILMDLEPALAGQAAFTEVLVQCGNDESIGSKADVFDAATFTTRLTELMETLRALPATKDARITLLTPLVMRDAWVYAKGSGQPERRCQELAEAVVALAKKEGCTLIDLYAWSDQTFVDDTTTSHNRGIIWPDGLGWEPVGYGQVALQIDHHRSGEETSPTPLLTATPAVGEALALAPETPPAPPRHVSPGVLFAVPPALLTGERAAFLVTATEGSVAIAGAHKVETAAMPALRITCADGTQLVLAAGERELGAVTAESDGFPQTRGSDAIQLGYAAIGEDLPDQGIPRTDTWLNASGARWRPLACAVAGKRRAVIVAFDLGGLEGKKITTARLQLYSGSVDQQGRFGPRAETETLVVKPLLGEDAKAIPHLATWRTRDGLHPWSGAAE